MSKSKLLQTLNTQQLQSVTYTKGSLLIIAGAGTGKTTVITHKIAWLLEQKIASPDEILALAFTDKAAQEMEERVDILLPYGVFDLWISTFHSFCQRILENHALDVGLAHDYRLIDTTESWLLTRKNLYKFNLDYYRPRGNPSKFIHALLNLFSRLKDENITPEEYLKYAESLTSQVDNTMSDESTKLESRRIKETADCYFQYQQLLLDNNFLDFGDLIYYTNKLFVQRPNVLQKYQKQFKYILVDEFQDTNLAQYQLIKLLANNPPLPLLANGGDKDSVTSPLYQGGDKRGGNLTIVGDDDQAIFKFRGASISNILNFKKDFPQCKEIVLTQNYRSKQNILDTAYCFIQHNNPDRLEYQLNNPDKYYRQKSAIKSEKIDKKLSAQTLGKGIIKFLQAHNAADEIKLVIEKIKELLNSPENSLNDIAILVRANKTAEPFILALEQEKISYIYLGASGLYKQPVIMDILSFARVLYDRADSISLSRVLQIPCLGISDKELLKINYWAGRKAYSLCEILENIRILPDLSEQTIKLIENLICKLQENIKLAKEKSAVEMFFKILADTNYCNHLLALEQKDPLQALQQSNFLNQFLRKMHKFRDHYEDKTLKGFIKHIDLEIDAGDKGSLDQDVSQMGPEAVKILTIHSAKGLEFKYIFIVNLVQQKFPTIRRSELIALPDDLIAKKEILPEGDEHLQEERRLFYVALTRAQKAVFLTSAQNYGGKRNTKPSQFLIEAEILKNKEEFLTRPSLEEGVGGVFPRPSLEEGLREVSISPIPISNNKIQVPKEFSYSQIAAFKKCPLQYKYQFILKTPQDKGKASFSFGRTMHNTFLEIFKRVKMRAVHSQASLFGSTDTSLKEGQHLKISLLEEGQKGGVKSLITLDEIYQIYQQKWLDDWYESAESKKHYFKAGKKILKEFFQRHQNNWPVSLYLEMPFRAILGQYIIKGRIDRIDKIDDNKGIEIIDYKTGSYKEKLYADDKIQLLIYQLALEKSDFVLKKLTYYYLDDKKQGAVSFIGGEAEIKKVKQQLVDIIKQIKQSDFPATPGDFICKYCDFKNICAESAV